MGLRWPAGEDDEMDEPASWTECQDFIERPRMRGESETDWSVRRSLARLSREILTRLRNPWRQDP